MDTKNNIQILKNISFGKNLISVDKNDNYKKVNFFGKIIRLLKKIVKKNAFDDCKITKITNVMEKMINSKELNPEEIQTIKTKLNEIINYKHIKPENKNKAQSLFDTYFQDKNTNSLRQTLNPEPTPITHLVNNPEEQPITPQPEPLKKDNETPLPPANVSENKLTDDDRLNKVFNELDQLPTDELLSHLDLLAQSGKLNEVKSYTKPDGTQSQGNLAIAAYEILKDEKQAAVLSKLADYKVDFNFKISLLDEEGTPIEKSFSYLIFEKTVEDFGNYSQALIYNINICKHTGFLDFPIMVSTADHTETHRLLSLAVCKLKGKERLDVIQTLLNANANPTLDFFKQDGNTGDIVETRKIYELVEDDKDLKDLIIEADIAWRGNHRSS